jgi:Mn2+/Fe2+ NRAMP family transporter
VGGGRPAGPALTVGVETLEATCGSLLAVGVMHLPSASPGVVCAGDEVLLIAATVGTTLAPWGLSFIQSYAVDKRLTTADLKYERMDVLVGAALTGVIGFFVVVACAGTLHARGLHIESAADAAQALAPVAGRLSAPCSPSASSAPRCSPRPSCRCPRPTPSAT